MKLRSKWSSSTKNELDGCYHEKAIECSISSKALLFKAAIHFIINPIINVWCSSPCGSGTPNILPWPKSYPQLSNSLALLGIESILNDSKAMDRFCYMIVLFTILILVGFGSSLAANKNSCC